MAFPDVICKPWNRVNHKEAWPWHLADTGYRFRAQSPPRATTTRSNPPAWCAVTMLLPFLLLEVQALKFTQKHQLSKFPWRTMPHGHAGGTDPPDKALPAKRPGKTAEHYVCSLTIRTWETTNRFPKQITANQFVRVINMEAKGSGRCDTSWLRKALDTIPFNFHMSKMRKWKLNENLPQIYALKMIICSSPSNTALSRSPSFCWQNG